MVTARNTLRHQDAGNVMNQVRDRTELRSSDATLRSRHRFKKNMNKTLPFLLLAPLMLPVLAVAQGMPPLTQFGTGPLSTGYVDVLAGLAYTDNALLTQSQHSGDGIGTVGLNMDYERHGRLSLDLLGNIDRIEYIQHSFSGSFYGQFNGDALWGKPTDPIQWMLNDSFGEGMTDPLAAPTPTNLQWVNQVSTGPFLNLNLGLRNRLTVYGEYARSIYQRSPYGSQTFEGGAQISHQLAGDTSISVLASDARTKYTNRAALASTPGAGSAYNVKQAAIQFQGRYVRTNVSLAAGYNTIDFGGGTHGSPYYSVQLSRSISPSSTVYVSGQSEYSSFGGAMQSPTAQLGVQGGGLQSGPGLITSQPFKSRIGTLGWNFHRARTSLSLNGSYQQDLYDLQPQDDSRDESVNLTLSRQIRRTVSIQLSGHGSYDDYTQLNARTHRYDVTLTLMKQMARASFAIYVLRTQQNGSPGASGFAAASYHDDMVGMYFTYDVFGQRNSGGGTGMGGGMPGLPGGM